MHPSLAIVPVAAFMFVFGWIIYRLVIRRVIQLDLFTSLLATFGLAITIQQSLNLVFGPDVRTLKSGFGRYELFDGDGRHHADPAHRLRPVPACSRSRWCCS